MNYFEFHSFFNIIIITKSTALISMHTYVCQLNMKYARRYTLLRVQYICCLTFLRKLNAIGKEKKKAMIDQQVYK